MKTRLSCQRCYMYKRKCDQKKPSCSGCRKVPGQSCDYTSAALASARIPSTSRVVKKRKIHLADTSPLLYESEQLPSPTESYGENVWGSANDMTEFWNENNMLPAINTDLVSPRVAAQMPEVSPDMFLSYVWKIEMHPSSELSCSSTSSSIGRPWDNNFS
jgi:hypothetical protein